MVGAVTTTVVIVGVFLIADSALGTVLTLYIEFFEIYKKILLH